MVETYKLSFRVDKELVKKLDEICEQKGYAKRSEALKDAIEEFVRRKKQPKRFVAIDLGQLPEKTFRNLKWLIENGYEISAEDVAIRATREYVLQRQLQMILWEHYGYSIKEQLGAGKSCSKYSAIPKDVLEDITNAQKRINEDE